MTLPKETAPGGLPEAPPKGRALAIQTPRGGEIRPGGLHEGGVHLKLMQREARTIDSAFTGMICRMGRD